MNDAPETIYLIPDSPEGVPDYAWCDDPAPGLGMDPKDAIKYLRSDSIEDAPEAAKARIAELESYNLGLANESHAQQETIRELKAQMQRDAGHRKKKGLILDQAMRGLRHSAEQPHDGRMDAVRAMAGRIAELETLIADIKAWDVDKAAEEIARGQDLNLQVPPAIRKRIQAALDARQATPEANP
ncbi:hypothetical protein [Alcanivorax sp.]|jgi:hypothetical protein|uniref:hypothetical protein n=1 Tax=Alcanivorax sp. TaxID=1872427 RepID=UPI0032D98609